MAVGDILENSFFNYISKPLHLLNYETDSQISVFKKNLRDISFKVRGESRNDFKENLKTNPELLLLLYNDMIKKVMDIERDLFETRTDGVYYKHNGANLLIDKPKLPFSIYAYWIFEYCKVIRSIFAEHLEQTNKILETEKHQIDQTKYTPKNKLVNKRIRRDGFKPSFELINDNVNLNPIHKVLEDNEFIQKIKFSDFEQVFSGEQINHKITWGNANSLRYFINGIYKKSVKNAGEGKWKRTIKCFKSPLREFTSFDFKNTKDPAGSTTFYLDEAIRLMNKP